MEECKSHSAYKVYMCVHVCLCMSLCECMCVHACVCACLFVFVPYYVVKIILS